MLTSSVMTAVIKLSAVKGSRMAEVLPDILEDLAERRRGLLIKGCIGFMRIKNTFTIEEVTERSDAGVSTPLDLMPNEFWSPEDLPFPRFGEEMLGKDF